MLSPLILPVIGMRSTKGALPRKVRWVKRERFVPVL